MTESNEENPLPLTELLPPLPPLVGLAGYAGSGKDTVGQILVEDYGYTRVSFAGPLYEALYRLNPLIPTPHRNNGTVTRLQILVDETSWDVVKRNYPEVRELLQRLGSEVGRDLFGEYFWVDIALNEVAKYPRVVITDVRFTNELHAVLDEGGKVVRLARPGFEPVNDHASDNVLSDFNPLYTAVIANDGDLFDLRRSVAALMLP